MTNHDLFTAIKMRGFLQKEQLHGFSIHLELGRKKKMCLQKQKNKNRLLAAVLQILLHS